MTANRTQHFVDVLYPDMFRHLALWTGPMQCPWPVVGLGHLRLSPNDHVRMSKTQHQLAKGYKGHWSKEIIHMEAVQDTSPMTYVVAALQANLSWGPSMDRSSRRSYRWTTFMWRPSWTCASVGTPPSTWLSGPATRTISTPEKVTWLASVAIQSCPSAPWNFTDGVRVACLQSAPRCWMLHSLLPMPWSSSNASQVLYP